MPTPLTRTKLSQQMFDAIIDHIVDNDLQPGSSLPSTAALCEQFAASRPVVREALSALEAVGLVEVHNGRNAVVKELDGHLIELFLSRVLRNNRRPLTDMMEVRIPLEIQAARLAAERASAADFDGLESLLEEMDHALGDSEGYPTLDIAFHMAIARATGNGALVWFSESLRHELTTVMVEVRRYREVNQLVGDEQREHRAIAAAIRDGDPEAAARAMAEHMKSAENYVRMIQETMFGHDATPRIRRHPA
ncbi:FadR/GntR family transcriptional regulator [Arthrobacter sp. STN4]|uniref:FadR/GntR family transcriptional regulator n=1 Tax=Arthrobacter sp. STN4 TaxID=2923276 RepID=UPI00211A055C|nr:FadR/GntR family transcriptional regulator [Arthrobacter sp. STN4]MCQ9162457.1 FadR family transcriptional regulator [Arthrobacter sp. STN4]